MQGVPGPSGVQPAACTGGVPKALEPAVGLPTFNCSVKINFPRLTQLLPATTGVAEFAAMQSAVVTSLTLDRTTTLVPVAVMSKPAASFAAVVCAPALLKSTPRRYIAPKSRVTWVISRLRINLNPKTRIPVSSGIRNSSENVNSITATPRRDFVDLV